MKRPAKFITLFALVALFAACTNKDVVSDIPMINFEGAAEKTFDVSEILDDVELVRLETNEKAFIKNARYAPGNKYIVVVSRETILQFTAEGAFIRILAQRGGGPQEFQDIRAFAMDDKEGKLYVDHIGRKTGIMVFDLNSGNFDRIIEKPLAALNIEKGFSIDRMMVINDSLYCIPERNYSGESALYIQRTSGEFLTAFPRDDKVLTAMAQVSAAAFLANEPGTNNIRYMSRDKDTLFAISGSAKEPYVAIAYNDKFVYKQNYTELTGTMMGMLGEGPSRILFVKLIGTVKEMGNSRSASEARDGFYFIDKTSFTPVRMSRLTMGQLEFPMGFDLRQSNDKMFLAIPAVMFKEMLKSAIENSAGNAEALERWRALDEQISENDNPILLTGKMK